ncbi:MFS transporter [Roseomonas sp. NAR14]|uniref:MFS transporter n=1 Tax=Roseomonas acroporae TaxID=2937791 RepID=A0A9X1Y656_9PROT|nr:MFS transporter [Roseomonas acroporae]MCK8784236.1 MFS transporter [Roseomonas acroporae]
MNILTPGRQPGATPALAGSPAAIAARLDRLPASRYGWRIVLLLSLGGCFEFYDLFYTAYVAPGLYREGLFTRTTTGLFDLHGFASFVASFFAGLFIGTIGFGRVADRFGRRRVFTISLLWYSLANLVLAFQADAPWILFWRFMAGIGVGVELVTIDTYIAELVPPAQRGRAFAVNQTILFCMVPLVALIAWLLVPRDPFGFAGWRWVVLIGATGALAAWWLRRAIPESPRWLAQHGQAEEADRVMTGIEAKVAAELGPLPPPAPAAEVPAGAGRLAEAFQPPYRTRTIMMSVFSLLQTVGFYGFGNWVPTLLLAEGINVTTSLLYTFLIALAGPFGPLGAALIADRVERKWQVAGAAATVALLGLVFATQRDAVGIVLCGMALTIANAFMSYALHAYQPELFPTRFRASAVGFVYSWSRLSAVFSGYAIAFTLGLGGVPAVFAMIAGAMAVAAGVVAVWGPRVTGRGLESISH